MASCLINIIDSQLTTLILHIIPSPDKHIASAEGNKNRFGVHITTLEDAIYQMCEGEFQTHYLITLLDYFQKS